MLPLDCPPFSLSIWSTHWYPSKTYFSHYVGKGLNILLLCNLQALYLHHLFHLATVGQFLDFNAHLFFTPLSFLGMQLSFLPSCVHHANTVPVSEAVTCTFHCIVLEPNWLTTFYPGTYVCLTSS